MGGSAAHRSEILEAHSIAAVGPEDFVDFSRRPVCHAEESVVRLCFLSHDLNQELSVSDRQAFASAAISTLNDF